MKSFKQFLEQAAAAAAPAPTPKFSAKVQPKPKVSDPSTGVDIDDQGRWEGDIVNTGQELEPGYEKKVKDGTSGPDPNLPAGIAALIGSIAKDLTKSLRSLTEKELTKAGMDPKQAKAQAKNYEMEFHRMKKGADREYRVVDSRTKKPILDPKNPTHGFLKAGGGVGHGTKGISSSAMVGIRNAAKAIASAIITNVLK